ncbi:MAG: hypothetical protein WA979_09210 [Pacificimonas sp.]
MLTKADDYPIHQRPEPIATAGADRNFYDRYFFNGQAANGSAFFAGALGVYPHLGVMDAALSLLAGEAQHSTFASRAIMDGERMDTAVGPVAVKVLEPLHRLCLTSSGNVSCHLTMTGRAAPIEEPRFTHRIGTRTIMDVTRLTQAVSWDGWVEHDGVRHDVRGWHGTRDRSWGVRPIGASDPQPPVAIATGKADFQFYWLWAPLNFERHALFWHTNDDAEGVPWNRAGRLVDLETGETRKVSLRAEIDFAPGTRHAKTARLVGDGIDVVLTPERNFYMTGIGYGHPTRGHGTFHGEISVHEEALPRADAQEGTPLHNHIQALVSARMTLDGDVHEGRGVLEQLIMGAHAPSGFAELFDLA